MFVWPFHISSPLAMLIASILPKKMHIVFLPFLQKKKAYKKIWSIPTPTQTKRNKALTFPKTNIAPENKWLEDEISYWVSAYFHGFGLLVSQRVFLDAKMLFGLKQPKEVLGDRIDWDVASCLIYTWILGLVFFSPALRSSCCCFFFATWVTLKKKTRGHLYNFSSICRLRYDWNHLKLVHSMGIFTVSRSSAQCFPQKWFHHGGFTSPFHIFPYRRFTVNVSGTISSKAHKAWDE